MKGILFKEEMYNAVVSGMKLQTRRIIKLPENAYGGFQLTRNKEGVYTGIYALDENEQAIKPGTEDAWKIFPRYNIGETVYLKEPYLDYPETDKIDYKFSTVFSRNLIKWKNKLFMKAIHARNFIKITDIRIERLHNISESDCIAEGILPMVDSTGAHGFRYKSYDDGIMWSTAKHAYRNLWKSINGRRSWIESPFVFVYEFELVKS